MTRILESDRSLSPPNAQRPWRERLAEVVDMMREMSRQTDPQAMVRAYSERVRRLLPADGFLALSRRDLERPRFRITRYSGWTEPINPWRERHRLPLLSGGLLADLIYGDEPAIIDDLPAALAPDDPARPFLEGMGSLQAIPNYDQGVALNMTLTLSSRPSAFDPEGLPERVWMSNLFGRATQNLVLSDELRRASALVDRELRHVADIQRSLLPRQIPAIRGLELAAYYQTSRWAGGDYYDFFPLPDDQWGLLMADVSGHGTPAAVLMAITHSIAHSYPGHPTPPAELLDHVNARLTRLYTGEGDTFVTAFYGIYDPARRALTYASAGHNPPRLKRCDDSAVEELNSVGGPPLGLFEDLRHEQATIDLRSGDRLVIYTDGITEAADASGRLFGLDRLDRAIASCEPDADGLLRSILGTLEAFTGGEPPSDDCTLLVAKVR
jgi:sigma-B regulation protein RsbU (phosphoserine phosphatase)